MNDLKIDGTKIMFHPQRVTQWQVAHEANDWELAKKLYPIYVEVSPVGACNHRCTFCAVDFLGYKSIRLNAMMLRERLREMGELGVKSVMFAGEGEPLLHTEINSLVVAATEKMDVSFTTNGVLLDKLNTIDLCSWVKVSVNAGTRDTYAKVHRTKPEDFDKVWKNIRAARDRKGKCTIGVQMVVLPENQDEQQALVDLATEAGVDYVVFKPYSQHKMSITHEYENFRPRPQVKFSPVNGPEVYWRDDAPSHEAPRYTKCYSTPTMWAYLMSSGDLYSCSAYLLDERFKLGNLNEHSFKEVWEGDRRRANWEFVRKELDISECRLNCRMHKSNEYLWDLAQGVQHQNFV